MNLQVRVHQFVAHISAVTTLGSSTPGHNLRRALKDPLAKIFLNRVRLNSRRGYIYIYIYIHTYIYISLSLCTMYLYINLFIHVFIHVSIYLFASIYIYISRKQKKSQGPSNRSIATDGSKCSPGCLNLLHVPQLIKQSNAVAITTNAPRPCHNLDAGVA